MQTKAKTRGSSVYETLCLIVSRCVIGLGPHCSSWLWFPLFHVRTSALKLCADQSAEGIFFCIVMPLLVLLNNPSPALGAECQPRQLVPHWLWLLRSSKGVIQRSPLRGGSGGTEYRSGELFFASHLSLEKREGEWIKLLGSTAAGSALWVVVIRSCLCLALWVFRVTLLRHLHHFWSLLCV